MRSDKLIRFYKSKKALIPGGAGFIGSSIARRLVGYGAHVTVVDSFDRLCGANPFNMRGLEGRARIVRSKIEHFIRKNDIRKFDIIFNCVGLTDHHIGYKNPDADYRINCKSALSLLKKMAEKKAGCRMVSMGSRSQYGRPEGKNVDESHVMRPLDVQATHKVISECCHNFFFSRYRLDLLYVRMTNVYGPGQRLKGKGIGLMGEMMLNGTTGKDVVVYGSLARVKDILFVEDAVNALLLLGMAEKKAFISYNLGGRPCKLGELVDAINKYVKIKTKVVSFPSKIKKMDTGDVVLKTDRLKKATGWMPETPVKEGIKTTLRFYRENRRSYLS